MNSNYLVNMSKIDNILQEIDEAFYDIPFGNSNFQNLAFMMGSQITPERAYRALGLRLQDRLRALQSSKYGRMKTAIEIEEKKFKIADENTDFFKKELLKIELLELENNLRYTDKLINDAIEECNFLYSVFLKFPRYTREQFEAGEELHFVELAKRQIVGITGGRETLVNATQDKLEFEKVLNLLTDTKPEEYQKLAFEMANKVFADGSLGNPEELPDNLKIG